MAGDLTWELWGDMTYDGTLGPVGSIFLPIASLEGSVEWFCT